MPLTRGLAYGWFLCDGAGVGHFVSFLEPVVMALLVPSKLAPLEQGTGLGTVIDFAGDAGSLQHT